VKEKISIIFFAILFFSLSFKAFSFQEGGVLREFGIFTGFFKGALKGKEDYELIPVGAKFGFDLKRLFNLMNIFYMDNDEKVSEEGKSLLELVIEPYIGGVTSPDSNVETGSGLLLKFGYKFNKIMPFIVAGTGFQYSSQQVNEEATQWNFQVQGGVGVNCFFNENKALNIEYRARHFSNAGLKSPNNGVDIEGFLLGISYFF